MSGVICHGTSVQLLESARFMYGVLSNPGVYRALAPIIYENHSKEEIAALEADWNRALDDAAAVIASASDDLDDDDDSSVPTGNPCADGHEGDTWELLDGNGIYCARVCARCEEYHRDKYRAEIMDGQYGPEQVSEPIDPE